MPSEIAFKRKARAFYQSYLFNSLMNKDLTYKTTNVKLPTGSNFNSFCGNWPFHKG